MGNSKRRRPLSILGICEGPVQDWNNANPDKKLKPGFLILAANAVCDDPDT
eukprot:CAMPEP_0195123946 /NCGR_PEP_ID=MMETSP0448-20130528/129716_1 /TAXON_ID=66468 /ORGANISM="Heterocapsa triquestra, Strain CCMP 448" /LENGTH=50 /DNA_ID=CAMNT_0040161523 /DNA_START=11 /DNA_END=160 /DNA_ORIENTATION=+